MKKSDYEASYRHDVLCLIELFKNKFNIEISEKQAYKFWRWHSDTYCASWLGIGSFLEDEEDFTYLKYEYESFLDYQKEALEWDDE